jgi:hypothetical protein
MPKWIEPLFDILYLLIGLVISIFLLATGDSYIRTLYGLMGLVLIFGDSFHLIPRILSARNPSEKFEKAKGIGMCVTSITMTVFYAMLYAVFCNYYGSPASWVTYTVLTLVVVRVILCLFPQNKWTGGDSGRWAIYRNIPFVVLGLFVAVLYALVAGLGGPLRLMSVAILLSFIFYMPVVLWAKKYPRVGMLMLPKTIAYIWILAMGLALPYHGLLGG